MGHTLTWTALAVLLSAGVTEHVYGWTPGVGNESATSGFTVDRQSRSDVVSFWHAIYEESEGYEARMNWTGSVAGGDPGATSAAFKGDVQRRVNYYRAMAGMDADMAMNSGSTVLITSETPSVARPASSTTKQSAAQYAAYMVTINSDQYRPGGGVATGTHNPHNPPISWLWDGSVARNGAFYSNLASGVYGPGAIDAYMIEGDQAAAGGTNHEVAHRRLILYSRRAEFATGDVTMTPSGNAPYFAANALYSAGNLLSPPTPQFIAWPGEGYFPEPLSTKYWSLSYPGADFSSASVSMSHVTGGSVSVSVVSRSANFGDRTLVWEPNAAQIPSAADQDQRYDITVSNVLIDGVPQSYSYSVMVINPNRLNDSTDLSGSLSPPDTGAQYFFDPVEGVSAYRFEVSSEVSGTWLEGAEDSSSSKVIDGTTGTYALRRWEASNSGSLGFHIGLTQENFECQYVELDRLIVPAANSLLEFYHRKRRMGADTRAKAEISTDDGITWTELWGLQGDAGYDDAFTQAQVSLAAYAGEVVSVRFSVERPMDATASYWPADQATWGYFNGVHIDDIQVTGSDLELVDVVETDYSASVSQVSLDASTAGLAGSLLNTATNYRIRLRTQIGNFWFPYGSELVVTPVAEASLGAYEAWKRGSYYLIGEFDQDDDGDGIPNGVERVFGLNPTDKADATNALKPQVVNGNLQLSHPIIAGESVLAEYSYTLQADSWQEAQVIITGGVATASVPIGAPACYLRWKVNQ